MADIELTKNPLQTKRSKELIGPSLAKLETSKLRQPVQATTTNTISEPLGYNDYKSSIYNQPNSEIGTKVASPWFDLNSPLANNIGDITGAINAITRGNISDSPQTNTVRGFQGMAANLAGTALGTPALGSVFETGINLLGAGKDAIFGQSQWMSNNDLEDIRNVSGKDTNFFNKLGNFATNMEGASALPSILTPFNIKTNNLLMTRQFRNTNGFNDTSAIASTVGNYGGKFMNLWKAKDVNSAIDVLQPSIGSVTGLINNNTALKDASGTTAQNLSSAHNRRISGDIDGVSLWKNGAKLMSKTELANILAKRKQEVQQVEAFQNGGVIGIETSVLPEGALHRELNHLEDTNPEIGEEVTTKGIPVVVTDKDGNIEQVAEIERTEWVANFSFTKKLEELKSKYDSSEENQDEILIEAGKLLAEELICNTINTDGQLKELTA